MTDAFRSDERFTSITEIQRLPRKSTRVEYFTDNVRTDLTQPHDYRVLLDTELDDGDDLIRFTTKGYKHVFPVSEDDKDYRDKPVILFAEREINVLWKNWKLKKKIPAYANKAPQRIKSGLFIDGVKAGESPTVQASDFTTSVVVSRKLMLSLTPFLQKGDGDHSLITMSAKTDKVGIIAGMWQGHPKRDVNLGWIFFYISVGLTALMFLVGLICEGWHWPDHFRHGIDLLIAGIRTLLQRR